MVQFVDAIGKPVQLVYYPPYHSKQPIVELSHRVYQKGISLGKKAMQAVETRLKRHPGCLSEISSSGRFLQLD